jgi:HEAT repeat protein
VQRGKPVNRKLLLLPLAATLLLAQSSSDKVAWGLLDAAAGNKSADTRARAAKVLGLIKGNSRAQSSAEKLLSDSDPDVSAAAAASLGQMGAKSAIPKLKAAVQHQELGVVLAAANALYDLNDPSAYGVYYAALTGEKKTGESLLDSQMKMLKDPKALAKFGFEQGIGFIPYAGYAQTAYKMLRKDDSSPIRAAAAQKLARDPDPRSGAALVKTLSDQKEMVRLSAADALAKRGDPKLADSLVPLFKDDDELIRLTAAASYLRLRGK